jgi:hypothetical protein
MCKSTGYGGGVSSLRLVLRKIPSRFKPCKNIRGIVKTRIAAKMLLLSCEIFSVWQGRILPL